MDANELAKRAQHLIADGTLPCGPHRVFAGYGGNGSCALCAQPIRSQEVIYEVDLEGRSSTRTICFHAACELIWRSECERHGEGPSASA